MHFLLRQGQDPFLLAQTTNIEKMVTRRFAGYGGVDAVDDRLYAGVGQLTETRLGHELTWRDDAIEHSAIFGEFLPVGFQREQQAFEGVALLAAVATLFTDPVRYSSQM